MLFRIRKCSFEGCDYSTCSKCRPTEIDTVLCPLHCNDFTLKAKGYCNLHFIDEDKYLEDFQWILKNYNSFESWLCKIDQEGEKYYYNSYIDGKFIFGSYGHYENIQKLICFVIE